ncbi:MAG: hypothetical protein HC794_04775 [Nitrospiraceae bacterium]|nr:hypothetical protein [Nitrospiraceae bacterium]
MNEDRFFVSVVYNQRRISVLERVSLAESDVEMAMRCDQALRALVVSGLCLSCAGPSEEALELGTLTPGHRALITALGSARLSEPRIAGLDDWHRCESDSPQGELSSIKKCGELPEVGSRAYRRLVQAGKKIAQEAGVSTVPGYMGLIADADEAVKISGQIGVSGDDQGQRRRRWQGPARGRQ